MNQKQALDIFKTGKNIFLTGAAGSGKTYVLREYIKWLRAHNIEPAITASTGIAATHLDGITIHSWCGIGINDGLTADDVETLASRSYLRSRIKNAGVLIIDEVSMLHHFRLDLIDRVVRRIRENPLVPFGGLQVILSGDFFQLPPILRKNIPSEETKLFADDQTAKFVYHSTIWQKLDLEICYLSEQHRQGDATYLEILNAIRAEKVSPEMIALLKTRLDGQMIGQADSTKLYTHNIDVDAENERELAKLKGQVFEYEMSSRGPSALCEALKRSCLAPEILRLKKDAKVIFVKNNYEKGYVNGTLGKVIDCDDAGIEVETLKGKIISVSRENWLIEENQKRKAEITQYPLRLAWAITVHKSQGMSLDQAEIDLSKPFERGMGYVALSRVRSLDGLSLKGLHPSAFLVHGEVMAYDKDFQKKSENNIKNLQKISDQELKEKHQEFIEKLSGKKIKIKNKKENTTAITLSLFLKGHTPQTIANQRGLSLGTILDHLEKIKEKDHSISFAWLKNTMPTNHFKIISQAFKKIGVVNGKRPLGPVHEFLRGKYDYDKLRLVRLILY